MEVSTCGFKRATNRPRGGLGLGEAGRCVDQTASLLPPHHLDEVVGSRLQKRSEVLAH